MNKKQLKNYVKLEQYESLKDLFVNFWGVDNKRIKKVLNKTPKKFVKYVLKRFEIRESWKIEVVGIDGSVFMARRETEEQAKTLYNKYIVICKNAKIELKQVKYLKLK